MASSLGAPDADDKGGDRASHHDRFVTVLEALIRVAVRILAVLMILVIFFGVAEVAVTLYRRLLTPPVGLLEIGNLVATFGVVMAVLIAIEIFHNIVLYLRDEVIHIPIVLSTALLAIARKIIVLDFHDISATYVFAAAAVMLAVGITYFLVVVNTKRAS
jgi:uncharacterized membrane protein (DUF373 family)